MNIRVQKISLLFVTERKETSVQLFKAAIILSVRTMNVHYIYFYFHLARNRFINMKSGVMAWSKKSIHLNLFRLLALFWKS